MPRLFTLGSRTGETLGYLSKIVEVSAEFTRETDILAYATEQLDYILLLGYMHKVESLHKNHRVLNLHPGSLPTLRGKDPQLRALASGVPFTHCTLHEIGDRIDEGKTVMEVRVNISERDRDDPTSFIKRMKRIGALMCAAYFIGLGVKEVEGGTFRSIQTC